jgi:ornithine cyclodeaminase/alanine dehydrogenase-like protein (mu-crystallin family)
MGRSRSFCKIWASVPVTMTPTPNCLTEAEVRSLLDPRRLTAAIETAFRDRYPAVRIAPRTQIQLPNGIFLAMSCYDDAGHALGIKLVLVRDRDREPAQAGGRVQATYLLLDPDSAETRLTIAANYLTDVRTAATTAVATQYLARNEVSTLGIFGTGRLARSHFLLLPMVRNFRRVLICGRNPERTEEFVEKMTRENCEIEIAAADPRTCAVESDVICTCTSSGAPLFDGRDLRAGVHLNLLGAFQSHTREADTYAIQRSRVFVDMHEASRSEMGELLIPQEEGTIARDHVIGDLHELVSRKKQGRRSPHEITAFKSVGCALEDLVAAELLLSTRA